MSGTDRDPPFTEAEYMDAQERAVHPEAGMLIERQWRAFYFVALETIRRREGCYDPAMTPEEEPHEVKAADIATTRIIDLCTTIAGTIRRRHNGGGPEAKEPPIPVNEADVDSARGFTVALLGAIDSLSWVPPWAGTERVHLERATAALTAVAEALHLKPRPGLIDRRTARFPSAEELAALPHNIRAWIADLETNADPAGVLREVAEARDTIGGMRGLLAERDDTIKKLRKQIADAKPEPPMPF